ncbi:hypothetical protein H6P81_008159 [Aristolochia fimbriata]|uniref:Uncharacterized protein n=1 Tax=Aristolochia fimbriata TaxID=158543 RepID=A0AAV7F285_ARIFI|nr:hypothetical protein H6P81_008159 [Aristolochia fimbriata]
MAAAKGRHLDRRGEILDLPSPCSYKLELARVLSGERNSFTVRKREKERKEEEETENGTKGGLPVSGSGMGCRGIESGEAHKCLGLPRHRENGATCPTDHWASATDTPFPPSSPHLFSPACICLPCSPLTKTHSSTAPTLSPFSQGSPF